MSIWLAVGIGAVGGALAVILGHPLRNALPDLGRWITRLRAGVEELLASRAARDERAHRQDLIGQVLELAVVLDDPVPVEVHGVNPAAVSYHPAGTLHYYRDHRSRLLGTRRNHRIKAKLGRPPAPVHHWSIETLERWLDDRRDAVPPGWNAVA